MSWLDDLKRAGIEPVIAALGMEKRGKGYGPCPSQSCRAETRSSGERRGAVGISGKGGWKCHRCQLSGDCVDLLAVSLYGQRLASLSPSEKDEVRERAYSLQLTERAIAQPFPVCSPSDSLRSRSRSSYKPKPPRGTLMSASTGGDISALVWEETLPAALAAALWEPEAAPVRAYLLGGIGEGPGGSDGRGLSDAAVRAWFLGAYCDRSGVWWVSIPYRDPRGRFVNIKFRRVPNPDNSTDKPRYMVIGSRPLVLFGAKSLPADKGSIVSVVEGELDVVAAFDYGLTGVVSGTAGADQAWPEAWLDQLEGYRHIILATDDDEKGQQAADRLVSVLGRERCSRARFPHKDLGDCLLNGVAQAEIDLAIERAEPCVFVKLRKIGEFRKEILQGHREPSKVIGLPTGSPKLDEMFGGWPYGLTVITGAEGTGKSTFVTWSLWEQVKRGVPALLTSFENDVIPAFHKLIRMQLEGDLFAASEQEMDAAISSIDQLPIRIVDHYGLLKLESLVETIRYSIRRHGTKIVMIDHLGFMLDTSREDTTRQIDHVVRTLVTLARSEQIAILLIAHPREKDPKRKSARVTIGDLKGATSIRQDAALALVIEKHATSKVPAAWVHCDKQRGEWGHGEGTKRVLYFQPASCLYGDAWALLPGIGSDSPLDRAQSAANDRGESSEPPEELEIE